MAQIRIVDDVVIEAVQNPDGTWSPEFSSTLGSVPEIIPCELLGANELPCFPTQEEALDAGEELIKKYNGWQYVQTFHQYEMFVICSPCDDEWGYLLTNESLGRIITAGGFIDSAAAIAAAEEFVLRQIKDVSHELNAAH